MDYTKVEHEPGAFLGTTRARMEPVPDVPPGPKGDLARLLRHYRTERGLSQSHLAHEMTARGHGWHQTTVVKTERAEREPRYTELLALGQILRIDLGVLLRPAVGSGPPSWELQALRQEERLLALRAELQARDLAVLQEQSKDTREQLRRVRRAIKDAEKASAHTD